ncbi:iron ABC transporter ATP-binding protein [Boudabousia tangfeifanii]|uniref:Iron ABC transporter ATP-binding protein n=1 Tax=Boudabousia tangfeifanii TaxID=1912795 RepID=A0A1D9MN07_9ACTO|nr:iron ABC transporter ATP-binding protein [Boudabousia tangfeifanii]
MLKTEGLLRAYGEHVVVDQVSLDLPHGGVTALLGPNGAGKSTLLSLLARLQTPQQGRVWLHDLDVHQTDSRQIAKALGVLRQENRSDTRLKVRELVEFGRFPHSQGRLTNECHRAVEQAMDALDLHDLAEKYLDELSGGQRQRAFIAMVLAQETEVILLDEPLNNLDLRHVVGIMRLLRKLADERGRTIVVVLHDINVAAAYCDRLIAMKDGQVAFDGHPDEIMKSHVLEEVYGVPMEVCRVAGRCLAVYF